MKIGFQGKSLYQDENITFKYIYIVKLISNKHNYIMNQNSKER